MGAWVSALWSLDGLFLLGDVLATAAMGLGILLESPESPSRKQQIASALVMFGVVAETLFSVLLFAHDGAVSNSQQRTIIELENRLAARTISADDEGAIAARLRPFGGQPFEMVSYSEDQESADLASEIGATLNAAGWSEKPTATMGIGEVIAGVVVYANNDAPSSTKAAAQELVEKLNAHKIAAVLRAGSNKDDAILKITVGIKP